MGNLDSITTNQAAMERQAAPKSADGRFEFPVEGRDPAREAARCDRRRRCTLGTENNGRLSMLRLATVLFLSTISTALAQTNRIELKRGDLTGTNMEIIIAVLEVPPGSSIEQHTHPGEEAVYVLDGATLQFPDGMEVARPPGQAGINVRDVPMRVTRWSETSR
jgi:hypothetical protein